MATDRFLIKFDVQSQTAIVALERLANKVTEIENRLNGAARTSALNNTRSPLTGGFLSNLRFTRDALVGFVTDMEKLVTKRDELFTKLATAKQLGRPLSEVGGIATELQGVLTKIGAAEQFLGVSTLETRKQMNLLSKDIQAATQASLRSLPVFSKQTEGLLKQRTALNQLIATQAAAGRISRTRLQEAFRVNQQIAQTTGFRDAARDARLLGLELDRTALSANRFTGIFGAHARRIAEGILLYQGFEAAVAGATQALSLIATTDRELTRLELVLGSLPKTQADKFLSDLGDIAIDTNTDFNALLSTTDLVASALSHLPEEERLAGVTRFQELAGQAANLLGPGASQEEVTRKLVPIVRLLNGDLDALAGFLDKTTVAANRNAFEFEGIITAVAEASSGIRAAGVDLDFFTLLVDELLKTTNETASSIGSTFQTIFGRLQRSPDEVQSALDEISQGFISVRDEAGNIKQADDFLLELVASAEAGEITTQQLTEALSALTGVLSVGQTGFLSAVGRAIPVVVERANELNDSFNALKDASDELVDSLAGQFGVLVQKVIAGVIAMKDQIGGFLTILLALANGFIDFLGFLGPGFAQFTGFVLGGLLAIKAFTAGLALLQTLLAALQAGALLKAAGGLTTLGRAADAATAATTPFNAATFKAKANAQGLAPATEAASKGLLTMSGAMAAARGAAFALLGVLSSLAPLLAIVAAFDVAKFIGDVNSLEGGQHQQVGSLALGQDEAGLIELRRRLQAERDAQQAAINALNENPVSGQAGENVGRLLARGALDDEISEVNRLLEILNQRGSDGVITAEDLGEAFRSTASASDETTSALERQWQEQQRQIEQERRLAEQMAAHRTAEELMVSLADERVAALDSLNQRLGEGAISQEQYAEGTRQISEASSLASRLVTEFGDRLGRIPLLEAAAQQGTEELTSALFDLILRSGDSNQAIEALIRKMLQLAGANAGVAASLRANPLIAFIGTARVGTVGASIVDPQTGLRRRVSPGFVQSPAVNAAAGIEAQINRLIDNLASQFNIGSSQIFGSGPGGSSAGGGGGGGGASTPAARVRPQASVIDIEDLRRRDIDNIIAIATRLRNRIPGERENSRDAIASFIKDGRFIRNVRGIDDRLLRIAIDTLTDRMERLAEIEERKLQRDAILRNLVVNTGSTSTLITQPTLFGVGGNIAQGNGLNFDPSRGNFVINVPVELKGLQPAELQRMIYNIIARAIRDSMRL